MFFSLYFLLLVVIAQDKRDRTRGGHDLIVWVASAMMVFSTAVRTNCSFDRQKYDTETLAQHLIIDVVRASEGLTGSKDPELYFHSVTNGSFLAKTVLWMGQTVLGDCILVRSPSVNVSKRC